MDTITTYLENMFAAFPQTAEVLNLKAEMLGNMQERYQKLKADGASENEAIGRVIADFGNIEELIGSLGLDQPKPSAGPEEYQAQREELPRLDLAEAEQFVTLAGRAATLVAAGVMLCFTGVIFLIFSYTLGESVALFGNDYLGLIGLFVCVVPAVGLFVYGGYLLQPYEETVEQGYFLLSQGDREILRARLAEANRRGRICVLLGVCLCVVSPVALFVGMMLDEDLGSRYGLCVMLVIVACAVWQFIYGTRTEEAYKKLLQATRFHRHEQAEQQDRAERVTGIVASVVFPLCALVYVLIGLFANLWHPGWIIFPVAGILFGIFSAVINSIYS